MHLILIVLCYGNIDTKFICPLMIYDTGVTIPIPVLLDIREALHIDIVHEKRHMDVLLETLLPPPLLKNVTLFSIFILQALRLSVGYKSI